MAETIELAASERHRTYEPFGSGIVKRDIPVLTAAKRKPDDADRNLSLVQNLSPSLASILRPQAAYRWLLPYLASITPTYVEGVLRGALAGNHVQAWELFDLMLDTDPEINACVNEWVEGVLGKKFIFDPYHDEDEEPSDKAVEKAKLCSAALRAMRPDQFNDENDLYGTVRDVLFGRFHGQSVLEIDWESSPASGELNLRELPGFDRPVLCPRATWWVHPVCYAWDVNGRLGLRASLTDLNVGSQFKGNAQANKIGKVPGRDYSLVEPPSWNWITSQPRPSQLTEFPPDKFLCGILKSKAGTVLGGSCFRCLAWWWVASNFCGDWLLNYAQLFGIPFRKATVSPNATEPDKAEIRQMLQACGSTGYIMLKQGNDVEFMKDTGAAGQSPQAFLFNFADSQKRKVILHQTMTGGSHDSMGKGGGKAFGEVEEDTKDACIEAGARFACSVINLQLIPSLLKLNYGDGGDLEAPTVKLVSAEVGGLVDAQRDQVLAQIMDVPESYLNRKYGVPIVKPGEAIAGVDVGTLGAQAAAQEKQQKAQQDMAKQQHAQQMAQIKQQGQQQQKAGDTDKDQAGSGEDTGTEARRALAAISGKNEPEPNKKGIKTVADALGETIEPVIRRLEAIQKVRDPQSRVRLMQKLLRDHKDLAAAVAKDDSVAKALAPIALRKFLESANKKGKKT